jgi:hypothetical protein
MFQGEVQVLINNNQMLKNYNESWETTIYWNAKCNSSQTNLHDEQCEWRCCFLIFDWICWGVRRILWWRRVSRFVFRIRRLVCGFVGWGRVGIRWFVVSRFVLGMKNAKNLQREFLRFSIKYRILQLRKHLGHIFHFQHQMGELWRKNFLLYAAKYTWFWEII